MTWDTCDHLTDMVVPTDHVYTTYLLTYSIVKIWSIEEGVELEGCDVSLRS